MRSHLTPALIVSLFLAAGAASRFTGRLSRHPEKAGVLVVHVANRSHRLLDAPVGVSLRLSRLRVEGPRQSTDELWAPLGLTTGTSYAANTRPRLRLKAGSAIERQVNVYNLNWATTVSSVWPNQSLHAVAGPGAYSVWLEAETSDSSGLEPISNKEQLEVRK